MLGLKLAAKPGFLRDVPLHAAGEGGELGVLLHPGELDLAGGAVTVLADDDLGDALVVGFGVVVLVAVEEHHHVCVLLYGARIVADYAVREPGSRARHGEIVDLLFPTRNDLDHAIPELIALDVQAQRVVLEYFGVFSYKVAGRRETVAMNRHKRCLSLRPSPGGRYDDQP